MPVWAFCCLSAGHCRCSPRGLAALELSHLPHAHQGQTEGQPPRAAATRAVNVQLQAVPADVSYRLEWKRAEHGVNRNAAVRLIPYVSSDSTLRHAGAQQCMHMRSGGLGRSLLLLRSSESSYRPWCDMQNPPLDPPVADLAAAETSAGTMSSTSSRKPPARGASLSPMQAPRAGALARASPRQEPSDAPPQSRAIGGSTPLCPGPCRQSRRRHDLAPAAAAPARPGSIRSGKRPAVRFRALSGGAQQLES